MDILSAAFARLPFGAMAGRKSEMGDITFYQAKQHTFVMYVLQAVSMGTDVEVAIRKATKGMSDRMDYAALEAAAKASREAVAYKGPFDE